MKMMVTIILWLLVSTAAIAETLDQVEDVDGHMIQLLDLDPKQAAGYRLVMEQQRRLFFQLKPGDWQQELALYRETFALLLPVLSAEQHVVFVGIINSVIEDSRDEQFLAMEN